MWTRRLLDVSGKGLRKGEDEVTEGLCTVGQVCIELWVLFGSAKLSQCSQHTGLRTRHQTAQHLFGGLCRF